MDRRRFILSGAGAAGVTLLHGTVVRAHGAVAPPSWPAVARVAADRVLRGGTLYDGTGAPPVTVDVAITGDRISAVAARVDAPGAIVIDARGLAVAPGFIDIHSHTDTELLRFPEAESKVRQGVTTEVVGQDGGSVGPATPERAARARERYRADAGLDVDNSTLGGFLGAIEARHVAVNLVSMVGAGTIRGVVVGDDDRPATGAEMERMVAHVREALAQGAHGLSSGLEYTPGGFADSAELIALAAPLAGTGMPYATHMRNEDDRLFAAVEEALFIGRMAGVPVEISHLKTQGARNWWKSEPILATIEAARADGVDAHFDRYPYIAYSTGLSNLFPLWTRDGGTDAFMARLRDPAQRETIEAAVRDKVVALGSWDAVQITSTRSDSLTWARGGRLGKLAAARGADPFELLLSIMLEDRGATGMVGFGMSEENTERILAHPLCMICSDAGALAITGPLSEGTPHPRAYGTFARVLGHYVRDRRIMPLETAIHRMTGMPAAKLKLDGRGRIAVGAFADVVVFDPDTVEDLATFDRPHQYAVGFRHVLVNGKPVLEDGERTPDLPGRVLR